MTAMGAKQPVPHGAERSVEGLPDWPPIRLRWVENGDSDLGNVIAAGQSTGLHCRLRLLLPYRLGQALRLCEAAGVIGRPHPRSDDISSCDG
jgi:hypothetical protein